MLTTTLLTLTLTLAGAPGEVSPDQSPVCVWYRATKTVAFGFDVEVTGRSCEVALRLRREAPDLVIFEAPVPGSSFDSGHSRRDRHVADLLGDGPVCFESAPMDLDQLAALLAEPGREWPGALTLAGKSRSVKLTVSSDADSVRAQTKVDLASFGVEAPHMGPFAVGGRVHDALTLGTEVSRAHLRGLLDATIAAARSGRAASLTREGSR